MYTIFSVDMSLQKIKSSQSVCIIFILVLKNFEFRPKKEHQREVLIHRFFLKKVQEL